MKAAGASYAPCSKRRDPSKLMHTCQRPSVNMAIQTSAAIPSPLRHGCGCTGTRIQSPALVQLRRPAEQSGRLHTIHTRYFKRHTIKIHSMSVCHGTKRCNNCHRKHCFHSKRGIPTRRPLTRFTPRAQLGQDVRCSCKDLCLAHTAITVSVKHQLQAWPCSGFRVRGQKLWDLEAGSGTEHGGWQKRDN